MDLPAGHVNDPVRLRPLNRWNQIAATDPPLTFCSVILRVSQQLLERGHGCDENGI